jgi:YesN/AraC family two-component response regulator
MKNIIPEIPKITHTSYLLEYRLSTAIANGNLFLAQQLLESINESPKAILAEDPLRSLKNSLICSVCLFARAAIQGGVTDEPAFTLSDQIIQKIEHYEDIALLSLYEGEILENFIQLVSEHQERHYSLITINIMRYLNENITQRLSLSLLSRIFFFNPEYLSSVFKKEVGISITKYINQQKARESVFYLSHSLMSVNEIAEFYHFCNASYYIKVFRQYFHQTPLEYRSALSK